MGATLTIKNNQTHGGLMKDKNKKGKKVKKGKKSKI